MAPRASGQQQQQQQQQKDHKKDVKVRPKSNTSMKSRSTSVTPKKEAAVLSEGSLAILAREIGAEKQNGLMMSMYLNIPNTDIVNAANEASDCGLKDAPDNIKIEVTQKLLLLWKRYRTGAKEKDKVRDLERALRELGQTERADVINECHSNQKELTADAFSNL